MKLYVIIKECNKWIYYNRVPKSKLILKFAPVGRIFHTYSCLMFAKKTKDHFINIAWRFSYYSQRNVERFTIFTGRVILNVGLIVGFSTSNLSWVIQVELEIGARFVTFLVCARARYIECTGVRWKPPEQ